MILETLKEQFTAYAPKAAMVVAVVFFGIVISHLARRMMMWIVEKSGLDALAERAGIAKLFYAVGIRQGTSHVLGTVVWISGLLLVGAATAEMLGLSGIATGVSAVVGYLPKLFMAIAVVVGGATLGGVLRNIVSAFGERRDDIENPELLAGLVYYGVMVIVVVVAAGQAGLETELIESLLVTLVAIVSAAVAVAFALGSRASFHNVIAGHFLRRLVRIGDTIRIGETEGVVIRYFGVSVLMKTPEGEVALPCKLLLDEHVHVRRKGTQIQRPSSLG